MARRRVSDGAPPLSVPVGALVFLLLCCAQAVSARLLVQNGLTQQQKHFTSGARSLLAEPEVETGACNFMFGSFPFYAESFVVYRENETVISYTLGRIDESVKLTSLGIFVGDCFSDPSNHIPGFESVPGRSPTLTKVGSSDILTWEVDFGDSTTTTYEYTVPGRVSTGQTPIQLVDAAGYNILGLICGMVCNGISNAPPLPPTTAPPPLAPPPTPPSSPPPSPAPSLVPPVAPPTPSPSPIEPNPVCNPHFGTDGGVFLSTLILTTDNATVISWRATALESSSGATAFRVQLPSCVGSSLAEIGWSAEASDGSEPYASVISFNGQPYLSFDIGLSSGGYAQYQLVYPGSVRISATQAQLQLASGIIVPALICGGSCSSDDTFSPPGDGGGSYPPPPPPPPPEWSTFPMETLSF